MILILAGGHKHYGELAANLIMSIRVNDDIPIHLVWHGDAYNSVKDYLHLVDSHCECPEEFTLKDSKRNYFRAKTFMYELSPFEDTLFLDADVVMMKSLQPVIDEIKHLNWTIQNRSFLDLSLEKPGKYFWANIREIKEKYTGKIYSLHSEFLWFKKSEESKKYFDKVREIYDNPPVKPVDFAGDVADELAFALACNILKVDPHRTPFVPIYWTNLDFRDGYRKQKLKNKYFGYSAGGNRMKQHIIDEYNQIARSAAQRLGLKSFRLLKKRDILPERKLM